MTALTVTPGPLQGGTISPPGDKSVSHRAIILNALAARPACITGLLESDDVLATVRAITALGASVRQTDPGCWQVHGPGLGGFQDPGVLDMGNSGTGARLLMGVLAGHPGQGILTGDASLCQRPMLRVLEPLASMGASVSSPNGCLPATIQGRATLLPIETTLPVPSAQIKSALLIAALQARGRSVIHEPIPCRDHTERMLMAMGAPITIEPEGAGNVIAIMGQQELSPCDIHVPGDPSAAAFLIAATALAGQEPLTILGVGINPLRTGFFELCQRMGVRLDIHPRKAGGGEPVADLTVTPSRPQPVHLTGEGASSMIDEYPIAAVLAACAPGTSRFEGLAELRVKESDRLSAICAMLSLNGVECRAGEDWLEIDAGAVPGGGMVPTHLDHRIAMSAIVLGLAAHKPITIDDASTIATSFPNFVETLQELGANIQDTNAP